MNKNKNNEQKIRYCKKCGCELASTNKSRLCASCQNKRKAFWGKIAKDTIFVFAAGIAIFPHGLIRFNNKK